MVIGCNVNANLTVWGSTYISPRGEAEVDRFTSKREIENDVQDLTSSIIAAYERTGPFIIPKSTTLSALWSKDLGQDD